MSGSNRLESLVHRKDETTLNIDNPQGVPTTLFANRDVPVELEAVEQALGFVSLQSTVQEISDWEKTGRTGPFWGENVGNLNRVILTPDFHRGSGIPVGTVAETEKFIVPQAVRNDVCCGMRLLTTDVSREELTRHLDALDGPLRAVFFQGQREQATCWRAAAVMRPFGAHAMGLDGACPVASPVMSMRASTTRPSRASGL